jgi:uncharacterized protein (DUF2147 family)
MVKTFVIAATLLMTTVGVHAAEPIEGNWKTTSGATAEIGQCGSAYCVTLKSGKFSGKQIGRMAGTDGSYTGEITDPETDRTYTGSGAVTGNTLKMKGCVLKVLCKTQTWTRM